MSEQSRASGKKLSLLDLTPAILTRIFEPDLLYLYRTPLCICKALLPYSIHSLYTYVLLLGPKKLNAFAAVMERRPDYREKVLHFAFTGISISKESDRRRFTREASPLKKKSAKNASAEHDPTQHLHTLFRILPSLETLILEGLTASAICRILPFPSKASGSLRALTVIFSGDEYCEDLGDEKLLYHLAQLKDLSRLSLRLNGSYCIPLPLLNAPVGQLYLSPRSWNLETLTIHKASWGGPELRHLFSALTPSFRRLDLRVQSLAPSFTRDFLLVPSSLTDLRLIVGTGCPSGCKNGSLPDLEVDLSGVVSNFPELIDLCLVGNIVNLATLSDISALDNLEYLSFGAHTSLDLAFLARLLPPKRPKLQRIVINLCQGASYVSPPPGQLLLPTSTKRRQPSLSQSGGRASLVDWPDGFSARDAEELLRRAAQTGVRVEGTIRCAVNLCGTGNAVHDGFCIGDGV